MGYDWKEVSLGDICEISSSKRIFAKEYTESGVPFFRGKEIIEKSKGDNISTKLFISKERYNEIEEKFGSPKKYDILITAVGTLGVTYLVKDETFYFKDGNLIWMKNFKNTNSYFIDYWFKSNIGQNNILKYTIGSTQKAITIDSLKNFKISLPPLQTQQKIAKILSCLDEKIELNNKINANLEEQAGAIFNDLIYKSKNNKTEELRNLCNFKEGYVNPTQKNPTYFDGDVKWLRANDLNNSYIFKTSRTLTKSGFESAKKSAILFKPNTIVISKSGTIGRLGILGDYMCGNRAVINIETIEETMNEFIYYYLKSIQHTLPNLAVGSVQKNLYISLLEPLTVVLPKKELLQSFHLKLNSILEMIKNNIIQTQTLTQLRDTLLPKLMNGEIDVDNVVV